MNEYLFSSVRGSFEMYLEFSGGISPRPSKSLFHISINPMYILVWRAKQHSKRSRKRSRDAAEKHHFFLIFPPLSHKVEKGSFRITRSFESNHTTMRRSGSYALPLARCQQVAGGCHFENNIALFGDVGTVPAFLESMVFGWKK